MIKLKHVSLTFVIAAILVAAMWINVTFADHSSSSFSYEADVDAPVHSADEVRDILGIKHVFGKNRLAYAFANRIAREPVPPFLRIDVLRCKRHGLCFLFLEFPESIEDVQKHMDVSLDYRSRKQTFSSFVKDVPRAVRWRLVYFTEKPYRGIGFPQDQQFSAHKRVASAETTTRALLWQRDILAGRNVITRDRTGGNNRIVVSKSRDGGRIQILRRNFAFEEDWIAVEVLPRRH